MGRAIGLSFFNDFPQRPALDEPGVKVGSVTALISWGAFQRCDLHQRLLQLRPDHSALWPRPPLF